MLSESARDNDAHKDEDSGNEAPTGNSRSGLTYTQRGRKGRLGWLRNWTAEHKWEVFWTIFWALAFAWAMARFVFPPEHKPYYIRVLEYSGIDKDAAAAHQFEKLREKWQSTRPTLGDVPVQLDVLKLTETQPEQQKAEAKTKGESFANDDDTLMVIGHLPTGLTKVILPLFMKAQPPVPYISTSASADYLSLPDAAGVLPWLQPSPTNRDEAKSMLLFASQKGKKRCLVVTDQNPMVLDYSKELGDDLTGLAGDYGIAIVYTIPMGSGMPPSKQNLQMGEDCVLYVGQIDTAETLLNLLRGMNLLVVLSDGVIETGNDKRFSNLPSDSVFVSYATDAADAQDSLYATDAVDEIAQQLLEDLKTRGGDILYRLRSLVHLEDVRSARTNLVRIMKENSDNRSYYRCESGTDGFCIFNLNRRDNGVFHIWQPDARSKSKMNDVDGWHRPKTTTQ